MGLFALQHVVFPGSSVSKESACNAGHQTACSTGELGSIPGSGRSSGEGNGNPLQYSCLENPMCRWILVGRVRGVARVRHDLATKPLHVGSSWTRDWTRVSCIGRWIFYHWATRETPARCSDAPSSEDRYSMMGFWGWNKGSISEMASPKACSVY